MPSALSPGSRTDTPPALAPWRSIGAAGIGTAIELYDFQLYAVLAVTFSPLFFASGESAAALLQSLAIFAVGFLVRPIGGIVFGRLGDRNGRSSTLVITVLGIGLASAAIGLLPTYSYAGLVAPALLLAFRLAQGFFAGGELTGASTYISECSPAARRGFFGAFNPAFATLGLTLATAAAGLTQLIAGADAMHQWAWRIPFLMSIPLTALCFWARSRLEETPAFATALREHKIARAPLRELFSLHRAALLKVILLAFVQNAAGYVCIVYLNIHLTKTLGYDSNEVFWLLTLVTLVASLLMPLSGAISDRVGRKPMLAAGFIGYMVLAPASMYAASLGSFAITCLAVSVSAVPFVIVQSVGYPLYTSFRPESDTAALPRVSISPLFSGWNRALRCGCVDFGHRELACSGGIRCCDCNPGIDHIDPGEGDSRKGARKLRTRWSWCRLRERTSPLRQHLAHGLARLHGIRPPLIHLQAHCPHCRQTDARDRGGLSVNVDAPSDTAAGRAR